MARLVLASQSPRRRELLSQLGLALDVRPAHADESLRPGERPRDYVLRVAREKAEAALAAARSGKPLAPVKVGAGNFSPEDTGPFSRSTPFVPKIGEAQGLLADAFAAKAGQALPRVYDTPAGPVVAVVKERETPDPKAFDAQREAIESRLRNRKESAVQAAWLRELRAGAKVETNPQLLAAVSSGRGVE